MGKSALALDLAEALNGELISADSRQVYRGLDVGTAKPTAGEQARVPHHLIDLVEPEEVFSLAQFQDRAYAAIDEVLRRGRVPLLVGGTGLYVRAIVEGTELPRVQPDPDLRAELEQIAREHGGAVLQARLAALDPLAAARIDPRNLRRVIRALEVTLKTGRPFSDGSIARPRYEALILGLTMPRGELYARIDERAVQHFAQGMIEETRRVLARGCPPSRPALASFGYREVVAYLQGKLDRAAALERYQLATHRLARQQYNWFRLGDERIVWLESREEARDEARRIAEAFARPATAGRLEAGR